MARGRTKFVIGSAVGLGAGLMIARAATRAGRTRRDVTGRPRTATQLALEIGAHLLQKRSPLAQFGVHLVGFHLLKDDPSTQFVAHRYCHQVNEDVMECILFDGDGPNARLSGVEYIVSERLYETFDDAEKALWHPHNYEILSGLLTAPGIPAVLEKELMRTKLNSYGKTWHAWKTGGPGRPGEALPLGRACLAWSFNRDGEVDAAFVDARDRRYRVSTPAIRAQRAELAEAAHPQRGVDALTGATPGAGGRPPGVRDVEAGDGGAGAGAGAGTPGGVTLPDDIAPGIER